MSTKSFIADVLPESHNEESPSPVITWAVQWVLFTLRKTRILSKAFLTTSHKLTVIRNRRGKKCTMFQQATHLRCGHIKAHSELEWWLLSLGTEWAYIENLVTLPNYKVTAYTIETFAQWTMYVIRQNIIASLHDKRGKEMKAKRKILRARTILNRRIRINEIPERKAHCNMYFSCQRGQPIHTQ